MTALVIPRIVVTDWDKEHQPIPKEKKPAISEPKKNEIKLAYLTEKLQIWKQLGGLYLVHLSSQESKIPLNLRFSLVDLEEILTDLKVTKNVDQMRTQVTELRDRVKEVTRGLKMGMLCDETLDAAEAILKSGNDKEWERIFSENQI